VEPAARERFSLAGQVIRGHDRLRVVSVERLGVTIPMYDITTGTGDFIANGVVSRNCFARPTHTYLNLDAFGDFEKTVVVKTNVADVLRHELSKKSWTGEHVAMGTNTDPYQRCEGRYRLMPDIIQALADGLTPFSILTKGTLITRDLDVLTAAARRVEVRAALTIGMLDEALWRSSEPGTPSPRARLDAVRALTEAGIPTGVMLAPIMPGLNDDPGQLAELVDAAADAGATHVTPIVLHLRPGVREVFWPWLQRTHPELEGRYAALYRRSTADKSYREPVEQYVRARRRIAFRLRGRQEPREYLRASQPAPPGQTAGHAGDQLTLL
ncbi:MAG TPA: radical SAM protein, partial [Egibacteraceae bacterium]|nr:radical SAM protein [Egibacteraceae bacterium]